MRLEDQSAVLEWLPLEIQTVRKYQPRELRRLQRNFETVTAAIRYAITFVPEGFRETATITTDTGNTLHWTDIKRMSNV
jgi:hypothetical protein